MAGSGNRGGGGRASGGSSVAAGRKAKSRYQMKQAMSRFQKTKLPGEYLPSRTRRR